MDFFTNHDPAVKVKIDGVEHSVPRFLTRDFAAWATEIHEAQLARATEHLDDFRKAHFLANSPPKPLIDAQDMLKLPVTPEGSAYVIEHCLKRATPPVPKETIARLIEVEDMPALRAFADELSTSAAALARMKAMTEGAEADGPLTRPPTGSGGSPTTGPQATPGSATSTPAETPAP